MKVSKDKLIIFDMDGVLIDVTGSYREVVRRTVNLYLEKILGVKIINENWLTLSDIDFVKKSGGLNNDWDLTYNILNTILVEYFDKKNKALKEIFLKVYKNNNEDEILNIIRIYRKKFETETLENAIKELNLSKAIRHLNLENKKSPFLFCKWDVTTGNLVKRIFQEIYLGKSLFYEIYKEETRFYEDNGLIENEKLIPKIDDIKKLHSFALLSIATGRPKIEALFALKRFAIEKYFNPIVTEDDIETAEIKKGVSLRKPNPFILNESIRRLNFKRKDRVFYIGDMPDDIEAAMRAGIRPIGFIYNASKANQKVEEHINILRDKGAKNIILKFEDLVEYFSR